MRFWINRASSRPGEKPCERAEPCDHCWVINVETLDDLVKFCTENGGRIILRNYPEDTKADRPSITIYDDYIE